MIGVTSLTVDPSNHPDLVVIGERKGEGQMRTTALAVFIAALVATSALAGAATAAQASVSSARCADVRGPAYTVPDRVTHRYAVEVRRVSCSFARPWVVKLITQSRFARLRGPAGWTCIAETKTRSRLASGGVCGPGKFKLPTVPARGFGWFPDLRSG
jgi:hypothetical protein